MIIQQISIFAENKPGAVAEALAVLAEAKVQLRAFTIADTADFGIIRAIVDDAEKAAKWLRGNRYAVNVANVLKLSIADEPGAFCEVLRKLGAANVNVEYSYGYVSQEPGRAEVVLKVDDSEAAERIIGN
ncbi:MAG: hypothetical protein LBC38_04170 [Oscillospiraceae bacterium]|jgi:hypothetical protein|nr:hypothetical protein [Oscillospiraceae bacterium]